MQSTFNNSGTYTKSGTATTNIDIAFNNEVTGTVNVNAGTLALSGGGAFSGALNVLSGAAVNFGGGTFTMAGLAPAGGTGQLQISSGAVNASGINGFSGELVLNGGALNVAGTFNTSRLAMTSGTLGGTGVLTISGASSWTGGAMSGAGTTTFSGPLALSGNNFRFITGRTVNFAGATTWDNAPGANNTGLIRTGSSATLNNTGTWLDQNSASGTSISNGLGGVQSTFNNSGTYTKSGTATTNIDIAFNNTGLLNVQSGNLVFSAATGLQGTGTLRIGPAGTVTASAGNNTVGTLDHQGGAGTLNIGARTVTLSVDYNNANFGAGDAFNRRANVSTTGTGNRIIAAGDANQGVSGVLVSNGVSTTPLMVIGNVHVGATTLNYNIDNTGSTGPALRGAIQTGVNGGTITDARLSGNGVTAGNWGAVATDTGLARDVVVTINTAGVYAPIAGQAVRIVNNFDNTRSQLLAISSAAGAAAYNLAAAAAVAPNPVILANQRVGGTDAGVLTIANVAPTGAFTERLNASFGALTGAALANGGSVSQLLPGSSNNSAMQVSLNGATAGAKTGTAQINFASDGAGTSVLGITSLAPQIVTVNGSFFNAAVGAATPTPVALANQRVGGSGSQTLTVSNNAAAGRFSEALNAGFGANTGTATNGGGSINNLVAGGSNNTSMGVGVNTASAGAKSGTVTLAFQTDGTGTNGNSGLAAIGAGSQTINVSGNVYQLAAGQLNSAPLNFGTVQVGQSVSQVLSITNTAVGPVGFVEDLNARFGASSGTGAAQISGSGGVTALVAGATNSSALNVNVNTGSAGTINGAIAVNFFSAGSVGGAGNGLGEVGVGSASHGVTGVIQANGQVINQALPVINTPTIDLGNVRVGVASPTQFIRVTNQATTAPQAALNASISTAAPLTASGSFSLLAPGATNNNALQVGMDTSSAGSRNGSATLAFVSDASNVGNCAPNCQLTIASQNVAITGGVYRLANPTLNTPNVDLVARVGDAAPSRAIGITNTSPDAFTERLNASIGPGPTGFVTSGSVTGLAAGATSNTMSVSLNTGAAGSFGGTATLGLVSSGAGTTGAADAALASQNVPLAGRVYTPAVAQLNTTVVDFGIVHKGDAVAQRGVSVTNAAVIAGPNDQLVGSIGGAPGPFSTSGTLAGVAAQATDATSLKVGLVTTAAGVFNGTATASFASHNAEMTDATLGDKSVVLKGQVNNFAELALGKTGGAGTLGRTGNAYTLDFGNLAAGGAALAATLALFNTALGPADFLRGLFDLSHVAPVFLLTGFGSFADIAAGGSRGGLGVNFAGLAEGAFESTILLHSFGTNASGFDGALADTSIVLRGSVGPIPEPSTYVLMALGLLLVAFAQRRRSARCTKQCERSRC